MFLINIEKTRLFNNYIFFECTPLTSIKNDMQGNDFLKVKIKVPLVLWYTFIRCNCCLNFCIIKMSKYSSNEDQRNKTFKNRQITKLSFPFLSTLYPTERLVCSSGQSMPNTHSKDNGRHIRNLFLKAK